MEEINDYARGEKIIFYSKGEKVRIPKGWYIVYRNEPSEFSGKENLGRVVLSQMDRLSFMVEGEDRPRYIVGMLYPVFRVIDGRHSLVGAKGVAYRYLRRPRHDKYQMYIFDRMAHVGKTELYFARYERGEIIYTPDRIKAKITSKRRKKEKE